MSVPWRNYGEAYMWRPGHTLWRPVAHQRRRVGRSSAILQVTLSWAKSLPRRTGTRGCLPDCSRTRCFGAGAFELRDDRTIGPVVATAMVGKVPQRVGHGLERRSLALEGADVIEREALDICAGTRSIAPKAKKLADLFDGKSEVACASDEAQFVRRRCRNRPCSPLASAPSWRSGRCFRNSGSSWPRRPRRSAACPIFMRVAPVVRRAAKAAKTQRICRQRTRSTVPSHRRRYRRQQDAVERVENAGGDRDQHDVVGEGPEQVLADVADRRLRNRDGVARPRANRPTSAPRPRSRWRCRFPCRPPCPTSAAASAGASLMPSPTKATLAPSLTQAFERVDLAVRQHLGVHLVDAESARWLRPCAGCRP